MFESRIAPAKQPLPRLVYSGGASCPNEDRPRGWWRPVFASGLRGTDEAHKCLLPRPFTNATTAKKLLRTGTNSKLAEDVGAYLYTRNIV